MTTDSSVQNGQYTAAFFKKLIRNGGSSLRSVDFARLPDNMQEIALSVHGSGRDDAGRWLCLQEKFESKGLGQFLEQIIAADPDIDLGGFGGEGWQPFDLIDVMNEELPPISWIVKPLISKPSVTAWFGKPKTMKSLLALDMCLHVAGGMTWLSDPKKNDGLPVIQSRIVWIDLENGSATFKRRMKAIALALGLGQIRGQVLAYSMPNPWLDLSDPEQTAALISRIKALGENIGILVIDHLGQALGAIDENSPLISQVMGNIRQVAEACNVAIILIHHAKKGQGKDSGAPEDQLRGHGAILANVDAAYLIERDKFERTQIRLTPVAVRGPDVPTLAGQFTFEQDPNLELMKARFWRVVWQSDFSKARDMVLEVLKGSKLNQGSLKAAVKVRESGLSDKTIRDAISALEGTGEIVFSAGDKGAKIYRLAEDGEHEE